MRQGGVSAGPHQHPETGIDQRYLPSPPTRPRIRARSSQPHHLSSALVSIRPDRLGLMERLSLGAAGPLVTRIGLGLAAVGRPAYINLGRGRDLGQNRSREALRARAHQLLDHAYQLGIRYFDVARSYGLAEEFLASWLRLRAPLGQPLTVGSKWGYIYVGGWRLDAPVHEVKDHSLETLRRQYAESQRLLGASLLLYQVHSATLESGVLENKEVLTELERMARSGLGIGLTVSGPEQAAVIRRAMALTAEGRAPFSCVQATWNLLEQSAGDALSEAHEMGWGVLVKEVVANGRLLEGGGQHADRVRVLAESIGVPPDQLAVAAALAQPFQATVLSGAVNLAQLSSHVRALDIELSKAERRSLAELALPPRQYWSERAGLAWT